MSKRAFHAVALATCGLVGFAGCGSEGSAEVTALDRDLALGSSGAEVEAVFRYYEQYGYFPNEELQRGYPAWRPLVSAAPAQPDVFDERMQAATLLYQHNLGLPETGIVDAATRKSIAQPRCGFPDGIAAADGSEKWDLLGGVWGRNNLTWRLVNGIAFDTYDANTSKPVIRGYISSALNQWAGASAYTFTEVTSGGDILIEFKKGVLKASVSGSTTVPPYGDVTMNGDIPWTAIGKQAANDLPSVLLHELGHSIGLFHTHFNVIMFPTLETGISKRSLFTDDVEGALAKNIEWTMFDDYGDIDIAFNAHPYGTSIWVLGGGDIGGGKQLWEYSGNWYAHNDGAMRLSVNYNSSNNRPWAVRNDNTIGRFNWATDTFDTIPGCATDIGVGPDDSVWIIGCNYVGGTGDREVLKYNGDATCTANPSACWTVAPGIGGARISVGPRVANNVRIAPWVVTNGGTILRASSDQPTTATWETLPGSASDIVAGYGYAWSLGRQAVPGGYNVQIWQEQDVDESQFTSLDATQRPVDQKQWRTVPGGATAIGIANGRPLLVNNAGQAFWSF